MIERNTQQARAGALNLHGLLAHWSEVATGLGDRAARLGGARARPPQPGAPAAHRLRIGRFKPICDFNWSWPKRDRVAVDALMTPSFPATPTSASARTASVSRCWHRT